nr:MAG TPA: hypothetical protein [Bacteriophage sp.]
MNTAVQITIVICATILALAIIGNFGNKKG